MDSVSSGFSDRTRVMGPELVMMNNNYLPGILPYNGVTSSIVAPANVSGVNVDRRSTTNEDSAMFSQADTSNTGFDVAARISESLLQPCPNQQGVLQASLRGGSCIQPSSCRGYSNVYTSGGQTFTFTTPTQSYLYSPALVSQPRFLQSSRSSSHSFAPTGQTQWQHSVPVRIPWTSVVMTSQSGVSIFSGSSSQCRMLDSSSSNQASCSWSSPSAMRDPVPSCSEEPRRPKRHSSDNLQNIGPSPKIHLTEEKFAKHMEGLSIQCWKTPPNSPTMDLPCLKLSPDVVPKNFGESAPSFFNSPQAMCELPTDAGDQQELQTPGNHWRAFQDIEDGIELSDEEEESKRDAGRTGKTQPVVHMVSDIDKMIAKPDILPKNIIEEIQRPRMQVVLWEPPGGAIKSVFPSTSGGVEADDDNDESTAQADDECFQGSDEVMEEDECMDTEDEDL